MAESTQDLMLQVKSDLERNEGFRAFAYPDPLSLLAKKYPSTRWGYSPARALMQAIGNLKDEDGAPWTVGYGFTNGVNPDSTITQIFAERKLEGLILDMNSLLSKTLTWYDASSFVTKTVLINMAFNMGVKSLLTFHNTLKYIAAKDYTNAAQNMQQSLWYKQVGARARELVARMASQTIEPQNKYKVG